MAILIDCIGHMVSTENVDELHDFAKEIGLKPEWFQTPGFGLRHSHYDLTTLRLREKARRMGALLVEPRELVKRAWWRNL